MASQGGLVSKHEVSRSVPKGVHDRCVHMCVEGYDNDEEIEAVHWGLSMGLANTSDAVKSTKQLAQSQAHSRCTMNTVVTIISS